MSASQKTPAKSARRRAREFVLQGVYQWLLSGDPVSEQAGVIDAHIRDSVHFGQADAKYFDVLLHGVLRNVAALTAIIQPNLDRPLTELSPIEHSILLLATYELQHHLDIPYKVVINEAVEIAKVFGGTDGYKYINGVLDKVAAQVRAVEVAARHRHSNSQ